MNKNILIFDDDKILLDVFKIVLEPSGYIVSVSETSDNVLQKVTDHKPGVIIMDNWIPNIGGVAATKLLKSNEFYKHIPVILCSANDDLVSLASNAGANACLSKPFDLIELEMVVDSMFKLVYPL